MADSNALQVAVAASDALAYVGLPEASYHLTHATIYLATAPKSNSITGAMSEARRLVVDGPAGNVPPHLRSAGYSGAAALGHGDGYRYAHDYEGGVVAQQYFPDGVDEQVLFRPGTQGAESDISERLAEIDRRLERIGRTQPISSEDA